MAKTMLEKKLLQRRSSILTESEDRTSDIALVALARMHGAKEADAEQGVLAAYFEGDKQALSLFLELLDSLDYIESYELRTSGEEDEAKIPEDEIDIKGTVLVLAYVAEEEIDYGDYYEEGAEIPEDGLNEIKRIIKVNARGVKRIKLKCNRGYKYDASKKVCVKITGSELATKRKSNRRAILTKRSMGASFKRRVARKSNKAKRFRKALGLRT